MEKNRCTIDHITYQNQENGYSVLQASVKGFRDKQALVAQTMVWRLCEKSYFFNM